MAEPAPEAAEALIAVVNQNANVRTGPDTYHPIAYWLTAGAEVTVVGRNAAGDWLQIEHQNRSGWIFAVLTDIDANAPLTAGTVICLPNGHGGHLAAMCGITSAVLPFL